MKVSEMTNEELAEELTKPLVGSRIVIEAAARLRNVTISSDNSAVIAELQRRLKVAEDALNKASDAFRFCIEQCELELGPKMVRKLCEDGLSCERALAAIREKGGES